MPFDPSDDTWWPNPWPPRTAPGGGASYPYDWTDPFINSRAATFDPRATAPAPFSAAALGAMAWHPPIFLNNGSTSAPSNLSAVTWPPQPFSFDGPFGADSSAAIPTGTPGATHTLGLGPKLLPLAPFGSPAGSVLSGVPSFRFGLFGAGSDPTLPFAEGTFGADESAAIPTGTPGATHTLGLGPKLLPLVPFQSPVEPSVPALDLSSSLPGGALGVPTAAPARSVLFNHPPAPWDPGARDRDLANLDQAAWSLGPSERPISKSSQPIVPPRPQLSTAEEQALFAARLLSPNLVDYFTKTLPPPPPFPSTPGKIPSLDNPYAIPAVLEAATWLIPEARIPGMVAGAVERGATAAAFQAAKAAADSPALTRAVEQILTGRYGKLSRTLPAGFQANHLNQNAVYGSLIPEREGLSVAMKGNIITEPGSPHYNYHRSLEQFWDQYRPGGSLQFKMPTNSEYGDAMRRALIASGLSPAQASDLAGQAAAQRAAYGLNESAVVPRVPRAIWPRRRN